MSVEELGKSTGVNSERRRFLLTALGLMLLTLAVFGRSIGYGYINLDDTLHVTGNLQVRTGLTWENIRWALTTKHAPYWQPVTWLSLQTDATIFGTDSAWGFHLVNILWHMVNAVLALVVFERLTHEFWPSALLAALFAIHPMRVESVVWVTERKDVLAMFFLLLTMWAYITYARHPGWLRYLLVLVLLALGFAAKPMLVTLPPGLLLLDFWPLERLKLGPWLSLKRGPKGTMPAGLVLLEKVPMLMMVLGSIYMMMGLTAEDYGLDKLGLSYRLQFIISGYFDYLGNSIWPVNLVFCPGPREVISLERLGLALTSLVGITIFLWYMQPKLLVGWFWFLGTLVPVIGLVQTGQMTAYADRFTYMPHLGLLLVVVFGLKIAAERWQVASGWRVAAGVACVAFLAVVCFQQVGIWQDEITLFTRTLQVAPTSPVPNQVLAKLYLGMHENTKAYEHAWRAVKRPPNTHIGHLILGQLKSRENNWEEAERHYRAALDNSPACVDAMILLGTLLHDQKRIEEGDQVFRVCVQTIEKDGEGSDPFSLGVACSQLGELDLGIYWLRRAVDAQPENTLAHHQLGRLYLRTGRPDVALHHFTLAATDKKQNLFNWQGIALYRLGRLDESAASLKKAIEQAPRILEYRCNLAMVLERQGQSELAAQVYAQVLQASRKANTLFGNGKEWPEEACEMALQLVHPRPPHPPDLEQALELATQACQATQFKNASTLVALAEVLEARGQDVEAKAAYRRALALPIDPMQRALVENKLKE